MNSADNAKAPQNLDNNPLLAQGLPPFDAIKPEHALAAIALRLEQYQQLLDELTHVDFEHQALLGLIKREVLLDDELAQSWSSVGHLHAVINTEQWRTAYSSCLEKITAFYTQRGQNEHVFKLWQKTSEGADFAQQSPSFRRMVLNELDDFRLSGIDLPEPERSRFADISLELSTLSNQFGNQVLDATEAWSEQFDGPEALAGLPESALDILRGNAAAAQVEGFRADLSYPCFHAISTYADSAQLRQRFYTAHATRASDQGPNAGQFDNAAIVKKILKLSAEQASLLGYANAAELKLVKRMANSPDSVIEFLTDLAERAKIPAQQQLAELTAYASSNGGPESLEAWDIAYWSEKMREDQIGLSQDKLKDYFELESTLAAVFDLAGQLFGLRFERDDTVSTWHPDVRFYSIASNQAGTASAGLYIDLYSRKSKQGGAWMDVCRQRLNIDDQQRAPVAYLTCNFAAPADCGNDRNDDCDDNRNDDCDNTRNHEQKPSLLRHDDVVTLFHEFGHCLHHLLSKVDWPPVSGIAGVEWDAVELPSQLVEGWAWEPQFLKGFACHYQTKQPIPTKWVDAMNADRQFMGAIALTRQIELALTDLKLHSQAEADPVAIMRQVHEQVAVTPLPDFNRYLMSFSHLFNGGYAAGYYSYLWAERLARDAFEVFRQDGLWNVDTGRRLNQEILSVGGSRPMAESWLAFRGGDASLQPLLAAYGVDR